MSDLPPGEYSELLVGEHWPSSVAMTSVHDAMANRGAAANLFTDLGEQLRLIQSGPIANQSGITADEIRDVFDRGERDARTIATNSQAKRTAYAAAHSSAESLRRTLEMIAEEGNSKIDQIQKSKGNLPEKITRITDIVVSAQYQANVEAADCAAEILDATQRVFSKQGFEHSARDFAKHHGVDIASMFTSPDPGVVREKVTAILNPPASPQDAVLTSSTQHLHDAAEETATPPALPVPSDDPTQHLENFSQEIDTSLTPLALTNHIQSHCEESFRSSATAPNSLAQQFPSTPTPTPPAPVSPTNPSPPANTPTPAVAPTSAPSPPTAPGAAPLSNTASTSPAGLVESFEHGMHQGADVAPIPTAPPPSPAVETPPAVGVADAPPPPPAMVAFPGPQPPPDLPGAAPALHPPSDAATPYLAAPLLQTPPPVATATSIPAGPLPGYGTDLRAPVAAASPAPTAPPASPMPANPSSAPGTGQSLGQPTVVRRSSAPAAAVVEQAVTATSGGAAAGALSAEATARQRLRRLLAGVARQQPRLRWAAGERDDGNTLLVTDLASGWIPPHIAVPTVVRLLAPARRRGDLGDLLGPVTVSVQLLPGDALPRLEGDDPQPATQVARSAAPADELGWELIQTTQWRDGLPLLAHTLVKAACARTGVLNSEIALLREHLTELGTRVLDGYPGEVDVTALTNWQLLAAIESFIDADPRAATYHLGWFTALTAPAPTGRA